MPLANLQILLVDDEIDTREESELTAAIAVSNQAAQRVQAAWDKGDTLTHEEYGEVTLAVYTP